MRSLRRGWAHSSKKCKRSSSLHDSSEEAHVASGPPLATVRVQALSAPSAPSGRARRRRLLIRPGRQHPSTPRRGPTRGRARQGRGFGCWYRGPPGFDCWLRHRSAAVATSLSGCRTEHEGATGNHGAVCDTRSAAPGGRLGRQQRDGDGPAFEACREIVLAIVLR